jgi:hypothetical protein
MISQFCRKINGLMQSNKMISLQFKDGKIEIDKNTLLKLTYFQGNDRFNPEKNEFNFESEEFSYIGFNYILDILENDFSTKITDEYDNMINYFGIPDEINTILQFEKMYQEHINQFKIHSNILIDMFPNDTHYRFHYEIKKELTNKHVCYYDDDEYVHYISSLHKHCRPRYKCNENSHILCYLKYSIPLTDIIYPPEDLDEYFKIFYLPEDEKPQFIKILLEMNHIMHNYKTYIAYNYILASAISQTSPNIVGYDKHLYYGIGSNFVDNNEYVKFLLNKPEIIESINKPLQFRFKECAYYPFNEPGVIDCNKKLEYVLLVAMYCNNDEIVHLLLDKGADPNIIGDYSIDREYDVVDDESLENLQVPLFNAIQNNNLENFKKLIEKGANIGIKARHDHNRHDPEFPDERTNNIETKLLKYGSDEMKQYYEKIKDTQLNTNKLNTNYCCDYSNYFINTKNN